MEKLLSIVIPVYNMEKYLRKTLDSLICDKMERMQIIVVNDGSTDGSLEIAKEWATKHSLTVIDKPNGGHGSAWNVGIELAEAKYLAFLDSDDWIYDISAFLSALENADADLVFSDDYIYNETSGEIYRERIFGIGKGVHSIDEEGLPLKENSFRITNFHYCVYRLSLFRSASSLFHEKTSYDDLILFTFPIIKAERFEYSLAPFYVYRVGREDQSMASAMLSRKIGQQETERKYAVDYAMAHFPKGESSVKAKVVHSIVRSICATFYNLIMKLEPEKKKEYLESWTEYVESTVDNPDLIFEYKAYQKYDMPKYEVLLKLYHMSRRILLQSRKHFLTLRSVLEQNELRFNN